MAIAFVMEKYKIGIPVLKQNSSGNFKRLNTINNRDTDGDTVSFPSNDCQ